MASTITIKNKQLTITDDCPSLVKILNNSFNDAVAHRSHIGVDANLLRDLRQANSVYDPKVTCAFKAEGEPDVYFPLGAMKARAQSSWIRDTVQPVLEKMWEGQPTPIPELPLDVTVSIREQVLVELSLRLQNEQEFDFQDITKIVNGLVDEQIDREFAEAKERSDRMSRVIDDQWVEGKFIDTWGEIITDLSKTSICIVKGPVEVNRTTVEWTATGGLKEIIKVEPIMYRVSPDNFYPMGDVTHDVNSGTGIFELTTMSGVDLQQAKKLDLYNKDIIQRLINDNPNGWQTSTGHNTQIVNLLNGKEITTGEAKLGANQYHTIKYYGMVQVKYLKEDGCIKDIPDSLDEDDFVNVEAWIIKNSLIYLNINPYPRGDRPFCVIPREFVAGSIWGGASLQSMIETPSRIINALVRQQILNMGYASGPIGEGEAGRFPKGFPSSLRPRKMYQVTGSLQGERAIRLTNIPSHTAEYITTIQFYLTQADSLSGIPSFVEGTPGLERNGTFGQTGFYAENASRGIRSLLDSIDRFLIVPMLTRYYYRNLIKINDDSIKGDVKWRARGLSGVFAKQAKRAQSIEAVQLLAQIRAVMPSYVTEESFLKLVAPVFENIGLDIDEVLVENNVSQGQPSQTPLPPGDAVQDIQNSINRTPTEGSATASINRG